MINQSIPVNQNSAIAELIEKITQLTDDDADDLLSALYNASRVMPLSPQQIAAIRLVRD